MRQKGPQVGTGVAVSTGTVAATVRTGVGMPRVGVDVGGVVVGVEVVSTGVLEGRGVAVSVGGVPVAVGVEVGGVPVTVAVGEKSLWPLKRKTWSEASSDMPHSNTRLPG